MTVIDWEYKRARYEKLEDEHIAIVTMDYPEKLNPMSGKSWPRIQQWRGCRLRGSLLRGNLEDTKAGREVHSSTPPAPAVS
jgi:hypothetical protein